MRTINDQFHPHVTFLENTEAGSVLPVPGSTAAASQTSPEVREVTLRKLKTVGEHDTLKLNRARQAKMPE